MSKSYERQEVRDAFARTLRALRKKAGLAQERLALEAGVDRGYVGNLERGLNSPSLDTIIKFLPPLKVTLHEFCQEFDRQLKRRNRN
jgi:transcriptional regulator with XRE-family HTH domain